MSNQLLMRRRASIAKKEEPASDGRVWLYFDIDDIINPTNILYENNGVSNVEIDGINNGTNTTYQFQETGIHIVKIRLSNSSSIPGKMCNNCNLIKDIWIPEGVVVINDGSQGIGAFSVNESSSIKKLTTVHIPTTLRSIGSYAFIHQLNITETHIKDIDSYTLISFKQTSNLFANNNNNALYLNGNIVTSYAFPYDRTNVKYLSLAYNKALTSVFIPNSITTIEARAFIGSSNLVCTFEDISKITDIGENAFSQTDFSGDYIFPNTNLNNRIFYKTKINSVELPNIVTLGEGVFMDSRITYVDIGVNCTNIGNNCFKWSNFSSIFETMIIRAIVPPIVGVKFIDLPKSTFKIYVPYSADHSILDAYKSASGWSDFTSKIYELDENGEIPS